MLLQSIVLLDEVRMPVVAPLEAQSISYLASSSFSYFQVSVLSAFKKLYALGLSSLFLASKSFVYSLLLYYNPILSDACIRH